MSLIVKDEHGNKLGMVTSLEIDSNGIKLHILNDKFEVTSAYYKDCSGEIQLEDRIK